MKSKKSLIIISVILLAAAAISAYCIFRSPTPAYTFTAVSFGNIKDEVKIDGTVKAAEEVQMAFERSGRLNKIYVKVGDKVKAGQVLAQLDAADAAAQAEQARAAYLIQAANLEALKNGTRPEELNLTQSKVDSAQKSAADAQTNLDNVKNKAQVDLDNLYAKSKDVLNDAYAKSFDALNVKINDLFSSPQSQSPDLTFGTSNPILENDLTSRMVTVQSDLAAWKQQLDSLESTPAAIDGALVDSGTKLAEFSGFLKDTNNLLNYAISSASLTPATVDAYKNDVSLALAEVNAAAAADNSQIQLLAVQKITDDNLTAQAQSALDLADSNLTLAQNGLNLEKAGSTANQISAQTAAVAQAQANLDNYEAQLAKTTLVSPFNGTVSLQAGETGEMAAAGTPLIGLLSDAKYQISGQLSEKDVARVKVGQSAAVILDAYGPSREFAATVISIDPASTIVNGVPVYNVKLEFNSPDAAIKSGLTANIDILIADRENVLLAPASSLIKEGDKNYVIVDNGTSGGEKREVTVGVSGSDNMTEITSGLNAGDKIAAFGQLQ